MADYKKTTRNGKEYYYITITLGKKLDKQGIVVPYKKTIYGKTKKELERKIEDCKEKHGKKIPLGVQYFNILSDSWIKDFFLKDGALKASTKAEYLNAWRNHIEKAEFYTSDISLVSTGRVQQFYNMLFYDEAVPNSTIKKIHKLMRKFFTYVDQEGYQRDVTRSLTIPKNDNETETGSSDIVVWSDNELALIYDGFDTAREDFRLRFLIVLLANTGIRIGEALAVTIHDIDSEGLHIRRQLEERVIYDEDGVKHRSPRITSVKSPRSIRTIPLNDMVRRELKRHLKWQKRDAIKHGYRAKIEDGRLFTTKSGAYYNRGNIRRALRSYYKSVGVEPKSIHTYRHTFGTRLCRNGIGIEIACDLLGHESITTTKKYYVGISQAQKQAAVDSLLYLEKTGTD